jgi:hypothetical protein
VSPLAVVALVLCGCASLPRLAREERWDEVIARAEAKKRPPKRRAARAYAKALDARGRWDLARTVLLENFRHGGDVASLVAAAQIELRQGRRGVAAAHYGRAIDLDASVVHGDTAVCGLLHQRADALAGQGIGDAAAADLARADRVCEAPVDAAARQRATELHAAVAAAERAQTDARVARSRCATPECEEPDANSRGMAVRDTLAKAEAEGVESLRRTVARLQVSVSAEQIAALLAADVSGKLGPAVLTDDELRGWVGEQTWADVAPHVMTQSETVAAYAQLRLSIVTDAPVAVRPTRAAGDAQKWTLRVVEDPATRHGWKLWAWQGDLVAAELELASKWRPSRPMRPAGEGTGEPAVEVAPASGHWTHRVAATAESLPALLAVARLRHAAGDEDLALEIQRDVIGRALADGVVVEAAAEVVWHLSWGRPWSALAVAEVAAADDLAGAAASAILLTNAFCGGPCQDDADLDTVTRVLSSEWIDRQRAGLSDRALAATAPAAETATGCATLPEVWGADATGPVAHAVATARRQGVDAPAALSSYVTAIESDLTLTCAGKWILPLMSAADASTSADAIVERLTQAGEHSPSSGLQSRLAMVSGRRRHAELMAVAAAASSTDPRAQWADLAQFAARNGNHALARLSWREALLHTPALDDFETRRALLLDRLGDVSRPGPADTTTITRESIERDVQAHLAGLTPGQRWAEREWLAAAVVVAPWWAPEYATQVAAALWPDARVAQAHPVGRRWVAGTAPGAAPGPFDGATLAQWAAAGQPLPRVTTVLGDPSTLQAARLAVARSGREWTTRWRTAIGLAVAADAPHRAAALAALLAMSDEAAKTRIVDLAAAGVAAIEPRPGTRAALGASAGPARLVVTPTDMVDLALSTPRWGAAVMEVSR